MNQMFPFLLIFSVIHFVLVHSGNFCDNEICFPGYTPYDNMVAGLRGRYTLNKISIQLLDVCLIFQLGYDPVFADPLGDGEDPGLKQQIFNPMVALPAPDTRSKLNDFIEAKKDLR